MKKQFIAFLMRWTVNTVGIWMAVRLLGNESSSTTQLSSFMAAGLIFSVINSVLKPILTILALPAILLTLGLFTLIVNGVLVYLSLALVPNLSMTFGDSIIAGIILSLVNYIISSILVLQQEE